MIGGDAIVEQIFSWPGIGQYAYNAAVTADHGALPDACPAANASAKTATNAKTKTNTKSKSKKK